jgi:phthalate 3,4-dioxygenase beta subunit
VTPTGPLPYTSEVHHEVHQFLVEEAHLLDTRQFHEWLELMADDVTYVAPVLVTTPDAAAATTLSGFEHFRDDLHSLRQRVERLDTGHAWTEDPPSRTRRLVTNVRTFAGDHEDELVAESSFLLVRSRGDDRPLDLVSGGRTDVLRRTAHGLRLASRRIVFDESVLRTQNLGVFL